MKDDENIHEFHKSILEIDNSSSALGERMSKEKPVRKILRSLPKFFDMKVTTIEKAQDINSMRVDKLIGSLQTFELGIIDRTGKKTKIISFVSSTEDKQNQCNLDTGEGMANAIVFLGRKFDKVLKKIDRKLRLNVKNIPLDIRNTSNFQRRSRTEERSNKGKGIQCHGCEGFGHVRAECPTYLKKQKKGLFVSWSDEDNSEIESEEETDKHITALTGR